MTFGAQPQRSSRVKSHPVFGRGLVSVCAVLALLVAGCGPGTPSSQAGPVDCNLAKCVAFTFDDGPAPFTDRLLEVLNNSAAKATFFLIGNKVAANPDGAKRIAQAGMEIGNHSWEHPNLTTIPAADVPAQFSRAQDAIAAATGQRIRPAPMAAK